ncbi:MAG TPA: hydrogenase [Candidatus Omnitrophota bacterium]|nr:hydrogenase [Candidatus Omnitrophota bacterium]
MSSGIDSVLMGIILMNLWLVATSRISACIKIVAFQGILVAFLPFVAHASSVTVETSLFVLATVALKGFIFPWLLFRALREANVRREVEPFIGYPVSMVFCVFIFLISMWLGARLPMPRPVFSALVVPVSFATILIGFFIIISRTKALTQVLGYLVIENGIYVFGMALLVEQPVLVELAILLDVFVAVFVMGIAIFHISREFDHIDTHHLSQLRDWTAPKEEVRP